VDRSGSELSPALNGWIWLRTVSSGVDRTCSELAGGEWIELAQDCVQW
jgi:hypothetical protein